MANFARYNRGSSESMTQHYERRKNKDGEYIKFKNENIDTSKSYLNYNLAPERESQLQFIKSRTEELKALKRKDVNVMGSWCVTKPKELPEEYSREFFERSYQFLAKKYGEENVISAYVHMDETTPHMHFAFVPVVYDKKKERDKVSCKECVTQLDLKTFHKEFQDEIYRWIEERDYDIECEVYNGATKGGNKTKLDYEIESAEKYLEHIEEQVEEVDKNLQDVCFKYTYTEAEIEKLEETKKTIENSMAESKDTLDGLKVECERLAEERISLENGVKELKAMENTLMDKITVLGADLERIGEDEVGLMKKFVSQDKIKPIWERFKAEMIEKAKNIPLFTQESVRKVLEQKKNEVAKTNIERMSKPSKKQNRDDR